MYNTTSMSMCLCHSLIVVLSTANYYEIIVFEKGKYYTNFQINLS